jgi:hypothetical protein
MIYRFWMTPCLFGHTYLDGHTFDSETVRLLGLAFEITRSALNVQEGDRAKKIIAKKLIELAKQGERDPDRLSSGR